MITLQEAAYDPSFIRLKAVVGGGKMRSDLFPEWGRLIDRFSWGLLIRACERLEPDKRWPQAAEAMCLQMQKDEQPAPPKPIPKQRATPELRQKFADLCLAVRRHQP